MASIRNPRPSRSFTRLAPLFAESGLSGLPGFTGIVPAVERPGGSPASCSRRWANHIARVLGKTKIGEMTTADVELFIAGLETRLVASVVHTCMPIEDCPNWIRDMDDDEDRSQVRTASGHGNKPLPDQEVHVARTPPSSGQRFPRS